MSRIWSKVYPKNPKRLFILFGVLLVFFLGDLLYRRWQPQVQISTAHYTIRSSASPAQTQEIGAVVEMLYVAYTQVFTNLPPNAHTKLKLNLFRDRSEFRRVHRRLGWAEAFYQEPFCHAYYSSGEDNPYHWMLHEATHQLNREVAQFRMPKWSDEGVATYFSTSIINQGVLNPGQIDSNAYPIWWLSDLTLTGDIQKDIANHQIIPLRAIVTGRGGPNIDEYFNLYYLHWWSLSHFLFQFEGGKYREAYFRIIRAGSSLEAFEKHVGPIERIQNEWYRYLQEKRNLPSGPRSSEPLGKALRSPSP